MVVVVGVVVKPCHQNLQNERRLAGGQSSVSSVKVYAESGGCVSGPEMSVDLRSTTGSCLVP